MKYIVSVILLVACAVLLLSVRILLKHNGRFSSQHISENKLMRERGISCAVSQDRQLRRKNQKRLIVKSL